MRIILILATVCSLYSCKTEKKKQGLGDKQRQIETGTLDSTNQYKAEQIGWTMNIHPDWEVQSKDDTRENIEKGKKIMEKTVGAEVDASTLVQLINLRKGRFNSFLSTIQPFDDKQDGSYEENNKMLRDIIKQTYSDKGMKADYVEDSALIDGLRFNVLRITIYKKEDRSEVLLRQSMYSRLLNGFDFGMTLNCRDEDAMPELEAMLFSSKFSKRK